MRNLDPLPSLLLKGLFLFAILSLPLISLAKGQNSDDQPIQVLDAPTPTPVPVLTATPTPLAKPKTFADDTNSKTLVLHKPATNPAWGKVVEFHKETSQSNVDKTPETLYFFLFQDDQGVVRTAVYHESPSGDGYWEVNVWDR